VPDSFDLVRQVTRAVVGVLAQFGPVHNSTSQRKIFRPMYQAQACLARHSNQQQSRQAKSVRSYGDRPQIQSQTQRTRVAPGGANLL
jgi:hypothetical protein